MADFTTEDSNDGSTSTDVPMEEQIEDTPIEEPAPEEKKEDTDTGYPKEVEDAIVALDKIFAKEDEGYRNMMLAFWKKLDNYFQGIQRVFWDFDAQDWGRVDQDINNLDPQMYDRIVNIYRAHGEAIIAALSIKLPNVAFFPDDADNSEDIDTATAYSKIANLVSKHNEGILIFIKALFILFNQGVVAAYIYNRTKSEYGEVDIPQYGEDINITTSTLTCPVCKGYISESQEKKPVQAEGAGLQDEAQAEAPEVQGAGNFNAPGTFQQPDPNAEVSGPENQQPASAIEEPQLVMCPNCGAEVEPEVTSEDETFPQIVGYTKEPKSRTIIDVFGPMYAQMPFYARKQENMPYLRLRFEQHVSLLKSIYPNIKEKIAIATDTAAYDRNIRVFNSVDTSNSKNLITTTCAWFRPWAYEMLETQETIDLLKRHFPDGVYAVIIGTQAAELRPESLDEHWEITHNPLSNFIHADPLGKPLAPIQEIRNEVTDLAIETFEHGIPETFVDTDVLDFNKYKQSQATPGMKYPVKKPMNGNISDAFYTDKPASMSDEMKEFRKALDSDGQFVVGSFPSIYGGPATGGSKTAKEYSESRAMALQRLNTTWTMLKSWWARTMGRAVPLFANAMVEDEKFVERSGSTGFVNVWIKQAELTGKIGRVEPEADEELPTSFSQYKGVLLDLIQLNNDQINTAIFNPNNAQNIAKVLGWPEFHIPGQDDRNKQFGEFAELLKSGPNPDGTSTVTPEIGVDDDLVHIQVIRSFLVSPTGIAIKKENPDGYMNIKAHGQQHLQNHYAMTQGDGLTPAGEPTPSNTDSAVQ